MKSAVARLSSVLALLMLTVPLAAGAQPPGEVYRIGILGDKASDSNETLLWHTFRAGLLERGWNEGANLRIEYRWVEGNAARLPEVAADLVRLKPDVIATRGSLFTGALKAATSSIPIVLVAHADPVETGHVASLARPGGNITGMAVLQTELGPKGLELLHSVVPAAGRIAVLWHQGTPSAVPGLKALEEPARLLRLQLQPVGARTAGELAKSVHADRLRSGVSLMYGECMARLISTTVRLEEEDVRALQRARAAGHSASALIRKGLRVVASRYYTGRRPPSTRLFESTDNKLGDESELFRDLEA